jgi:HlyD family secretion protein
MLILGTILILGAVGFLAFNSLGNVRAAQSTYSASDLAAVRRGSLIATVSATGSIHPESSSALAFLTSGNVQEILVKQGDTVKAGQALARLDTAALELQLAQAEANLAVAQSNLDKLQKGATASQIAAAQANLDSANAAYDKLLHPASSSIAAAQANLNSANAAYNKLLTPDPNEVAIAKADVDKAKAALNQAQSAYDRIGGATNPFIAQTPQALQLQTATLDYQKALAAYDAKFKPTDAQLKAAQAQVQSAKDQLARLNPSYDGAQLAAAQAQIQSAKDALARLNPNADDLAQAQANLDASRAARDLAKERLSEATLTAPLDGTVVTLDLDKGSFVQTGRSVITVADLAHLQITLNIDETDIPRVQIGQPVALDLDAFPGQNVQGRVTDIAPVAATVQGVVNYEVKIELQSSQVPAKVGMTTNANIEVARKDDVLLIPNRAIRAVGSKRVVTVVENGVPREVTVTLGLSNDQETEVLGGVAENQMVVITATPANVPNFGGAPKSGS